MYTPCICHSLDICFAKILFRVVICFFLFVCFFYPLYIVWASLEAQLVKNPPAMQKTWVQSLGWADPLEKGKASHSSTQSWRIPWTI